MHSRLTGLWSGHNEPRSLLVQHQDLIQPSKVPLLSHCACEWKRKHLSAPGSHPAFLLWSWCCTAHAYGKECISQHQDLIQPSSSGLAEPLCMRKEQSANLNTRISSSLPPLVLLLDCACKRNRVQISTTGSHPAFFVCSCCWTVHACGKK